MVRRRGKGVGGAKRGAGASGQPAEMTYQRSHGGTNLYATPGHVCFRANGKDATHPIVDSEKGLKLFVTNRNTRLDFPTPVSPRSTTFTSCALLAMPLTNAFRAATQKLPSSFFNQFTVEAAILNLLPTAP